MPTRVASSVLREANTIKVIGDLHGNYRGLVDILLRLELIDSGGHWRGGNTHLVQLGDVLGRGGEPGRIFSLLQRLEGEALECGGGVHMVLGNHEVLSMRGTLVYNTTAEFQDIADWAPSSFGPIPEADESVTPDRDWTAVAAAGAADNAQEKYRRRLAMLGCETFQRYLHPEGPVGEWLLAHPSVLILGETLFVHGGLNRRHGFMDVEALNREVREEIASSVERRLHLAKDGPHWNRDFTLNGNPESQDELNEVLDYHGCTRMVVGHTPTGSINPLRTGEVLSLYDGKLWCADTGIGEAYGGHLAAVSIEGHQVAGVYL